MYVTTLINQNPSLEVLVTHCAYVGWHALLYTSSVFTPKLACQEILHGTALELCIIHSLAALMVTVHV